MTHLLFCRNWLSWATCRVGIRRVIDERKISRLPVIITLNSLLCHEMKSGEMTFQKALRRDRLRLWGVCCRFNPLSGRNHLPKVTGSTLNNSLFIYLFIFALICFCVHFFQRLLIRFWERWTLLFLFISQVTLQFDSCFNAVCFGVTKQIIWILIIHLIWSLFWLLYSVLSLFILSCWTF